ncbi:MAG: sensor histidine kinase [Alcanivorax sp.]|uniref:sensor histidine kinase n=1 Tax=Alloalcanivorax marinus TaxID=1177169 RepID=UPI0019591CE3|nr:sensor histidine kinase [Alloalcanivorax marinus]MBM7333444.1 sensor histidine kinase [Alloalcanivorax marinus]
MFRRPPPASTRPAFLPAGFALVILLGLLLSTAAAASPARLGADLPYTLVADPGGSATLEQVLPALRDGAAHREVFSRGYTRTAFWLRFTLPPDRVADGEHWLEVKPAFLDDIRLFIRPLGGDGPWRQRRAGDTFDGPIGDIDHRFPLFVLPAEPRGYEMLARVASSSAVLLQMKLWSPREFLPAAARDAGFWSFYFGLATLSALLALVLAVVLGSRLLWSVTGISAAYVLVACVQGYVAWLVPEVGWRLQHYLTGLLTLASYGLLLWMASEALQLRRRLPWAHRLLMAACGLILVLLLSVPLDLYGAAIRIHTLVYLTTGAVFLLACGYIWWRDRFQLSSVLLGLSPLICMLASLFGLFSAVGWIPFREEIYVVWQYALVVNMLMVTGLAVYQVRIRHLREQEKHQLARALEVEREARFNQRQFMGLVAHEFRTPLAIIAASLQNLRYLGAPDPRHTSRYDKIGRATDRLVQLTDNCLADARLDADDLSVDRRRVCLRELVIEAASLVQPAGHNWRLTVEGRAPSDPPAPLPAWLDPAMMRIALSNVIDNAVKHGDGEPWVDISRQGTAWRVAIRDHGPGIAADRRALVFERYRRATPASPGGRQGGVGLGLFVSRRIARAHGGDLVLADDEGPGCCFLFTLPLLPEDVSL